MRKLTLPSFIAFINGKNRSIGALKTFVLTFLLSCLSVSGFAAVAIVGATGGTGICSNLAADGAMPGFTALSGINVSEGPMFANNGDFAAGTNTVSFTAPAGWQFNTGAVITIPFTAGRNITSINSIILTATTLTFNVNVTGVLQKDDFTVNGLQVQAVTTGSIPGAIVASVSAGSMNGLPTSNMGNLSLTAATTPAVTISASPSSTVCQGTTVIFTPTPSDAVTPSYQWFVNGNPMVVFPTYSTNTLNTGDIVTAQMSSSGTCETNSFPVSNPISMTINPLPTANASATNSPVCEGGTLNLLATPTSIPGPYSYSWSGPAGYVAAGTTPSRANITLAGAGVYSVTVTDGNGCTATTPALTAPVTVNVNPTVSANANPLAVCVGGTVNLTAAPLTGAPTSYQWYGPGGYSSASQVTSNSGITLSGAGIYTVVATDANTCSGQANTATVTVNALPTVSANAIPNNICEGSTLALSSSATGFGSLSYSWSSPDGFAAVGQNTSRTNIPLIGGGGIYSVTVTDGNSCSNVGTTPNVIVNAIPVVSASALNSPICVGGTLNLTSNASGALAPYGYVWHGPDGSFTSGSAVTTNPNIQLTGAGVYTVIATDANTCVGMGTTAAVVVNPNPATTASALANPICVGQTLNLSATTPGVGTGTFTYQWYGPSYSAVGQTPTNSGITLAGAGIYTVVVTDANTCVGQANTLSVTVNTLPTVSANAVPNNICAGSALALSSSASGFGSLSYSWSSPDGFAAVGQNTSRTNIPLLTGGGIYSVTVTDGHSCSNVGTTPLVTVNPLPVVAASATNSPICVGGTLNLTSGASGALAPYGYVWHGPDGSFTAGTDNTTNPNIQLTGAGIYTVIATDANTCVGMGTTASVVVNPNPVITSATTTPAVICVGSTLNLNSLASGGTLPYASFVWNAPNGFSTAGQFATYPSIPLNGNGVYSVTVTDFNGCTGMGTTLSVTVNANPTITAVASPNPICVGNTLALNSTPLGGSGNYITFAWNGPNGYTAATEDASLLNISTLGTGIYTVTVTDDNGCSGMGTDAVIVNTNPVITVAAANPNPICENQTLNLTATAGLGSGTYVTYSWNGPAGYTSAVAFPGTTSRPSITTAGAGIYSVTVTDNNGCVSAPGTTLPVVVNTLPSITALASPNPLCVGTTLALTSTPTGGSGSYPTYSWSGPAGFTAISQNTSRLNVQLTHAGVYSVTVTDGNGCTSAAPGTTLPVVVNALPTIAVFANPNPICALRTLSLTATPAGGSGTYSSFLWNGPNSFTSVSQNTTVPGITAAGAGVYSVTVTDNNGCTSNIGTTATIIVRPNPTITANAVPTPLCVGSTLNLTSVPAGGSGSYTTFSWSGPGSFTAAVQNTTRTNIQLTGAGVYSVNVTDNFGCTSTNPGTTPSVVVNDNPIVSATATPNPLCQGSTLTLNSTPSGGGGIYSYAWNGPSGFTASTQGTLRTSIPVAGSGTYTITVTDNNNCIGRGTTPVVVVNPLPIITAVAAPNPICEGNSLSLTSGASGGGGLYPTFTWTGPNGFAASGQNTARAPITTADAGVYSVTVTDNNNCTSNPGTTLPVVVNTNPSITAIASPNPICSGSDLNLNSTPVGGSGVYSTFVWNGPGGFSAGTEDATNLAISVAGAGVYSVSVTDNNGCSGSGTTASVVVNQSPSITAGATPNPICVGNMLSLNSFPVAGSGSITGYSWSGPNSFSAATQNTSIASVVMADNGLFTVTVTDNNSCQAIGTVAVTVNALPVIFNVTGGGSYCSGGAGVPVGLDGSEIGVDYQLFYAGTPIALHSGDGNPFDFGMFTTAGGPYTVVATNASTFCTEDMNGGVAIAILPLPNQHTVTGGGSYCFGGAGVPVGLDGSDAGVNYQLYDGATPIGSSVAGTGSAISFGLQTAVTTFTVLATDAFTGCSDVMTGNAVVTTIPLPIQYTVAGGGTLCEFGTGFHIGIGPASEFDVNYQLYNGSTPVGAPVAGTGGAIDFGIFTTAGSYSVSAVNTITGCTNDMLGSADIFVNPAPLLFAIGGGGGYCIGSTPNDITLTGSEIGVDYQLFNGSTTVGAPVAGDGNPLNFGPQAAAGTYSVSATNTSTLCSRGMSGGTVVVIHALPTVYAVSGGGNYCSGGTGVAIVLSGSEVGVNYQPILSGVPFGSAVAGTGAIPFTIGMFTTGGTYSVVATNPLTGCTSDMTGDATVNENPLPDDQTVTSGYPICDGYPASAISLAASELNIVYELYNGSTFVDAQTGTGGAIAFSGTLTAGTYSVQAINTGTGCVNQNLTGSPVTVNPLPVLNVTSFDICTGSSVTLSSITGPGTWLSTNYSVADVGFGTGVVTGINTGTARIVFALFATGCSSSATVTVNQTPGPITGSSNVCEGGAINMLSNAITGGTWSSSAPATATVNTTTGEVTGLVAGTAIITYMMPGGCYMTFFQIVNALPVVPAISAGTTSVCELATITYTNSLSGGTWSSDNVAVATVNSSTGVITGVSAGSANIIYTYTNGSGCTSSVSLGVIVNALPAVLSITGPPNVCAGATITLVDLTPGGVWSSSSPANATINSSGVVTGVSAGSTVISYAVTNGLGCTSYAMYSLPVGSPMPASAIVPVGSVTLCGGSPVILNVVSSGTLVYYQWMVGGSSILSANSSTLTVSTPGFYEVIIGNGTCEMQIAAGVTVIAPPNPVILYDSVANVLYTGSFSTYQWYYNGGIITGATSSLITPGSDGVYAVIVTDGNGCADTATFTFGIPVGVSTQHIADNIKIYPNPATSMLYIDAPGRVFVSILSSDGRMLIERKEAISINVSQLADGMYMIMVYDEHNTLLKTGKFMKMQ